MSTTTFQKPSAAFWDKIAVKYARKPVADPAAYDAKITRIRALLNAGDRMLEIGCGTGSTALRLAPNVTEITATDISSRMIEIAKKKCAAAGTTNPNFIQADATALLPGAPFDVVTAFSVLHLVEDLPSVLQSVHHQLKPGGLFVSKTVCLGDANAPLRFFVRALNTIGIAPPVSMLSKADLCRALTRSGLELVEYCYFDDKRLNPFIVAKRPL